MAFSLPPPEPWASRRWKVKIRDRERVEPSHVSVIHGTNTWRFSLRSKSFLDTDPPERDVPKAVVQHVKDNLENLVVEWDRMYPDNPVLSTETEDE